MWGRFFLQLSVETNFPQLRVFMYQPHVLPHLAAAWRIPSSTHHAMTSLLRRRRGKAKKSSAGQQMHNYVLSSRATQVLRGVIDGECLRAGL